jgi:pimeloyl-ACP methyl ester carboxylesterase
VTKPQTRYAKSGKISIAYQVFGSGSLNLVCVPGWITHLEFMWEEPAYARFLRRLGSFARVVMFDKRGTGLSDRDVGLPSLEERMDDVRAVMETVGIERAAVFGWSEGGNMSVLFAATYPERVTALVLFGCFAKRTWSPDYSWAPRPEERSCANATAPGSTRAVNDPSATNVAQIVISGTTRQTPPGAVSMPAFGRSYSDVEIAAVANYVTGRYGSAPSRISEKEVADLRNQTAH